MTRKLIAGTGWKMNIGADATARYAARVAPLVDGFADAIEMFVLPPFTSLRRGRRSRLRRLE
jgi:triosephosphate isomerase